VCWCLVRIKPASATAPAEASDLVIKLCHYDGHPDFHRLKRKKWSWQFLAGGMVTGSMVSSWNQTFNLGHTEDHRFWALQDWTWCRKIVAITEVDNFEPKHVPEIAVQLLRYYDGGGDFYLSQMSEFGDIPLPMRMKI